MQTIEELSASLKQKISDQPIEKIKLEETVSYSKHPFRVPENAALKALAKDIKEHGLLEPIIVRVLGFGGRYEILSGHRRVASQKLNGAIEIEARVVKVSDIEAAQIVINSNFLQRDKILPSERAKSYMLRNECLKKEKYGAVSNGWTKVDEYTQDVLAKEFDVSKSSIFMYIRLNYLINEFLELVDDAKIKLSLAVDLSYFPKGRQVVIYKYFFVDKKDVLKTDTLKEMKKNLTNITEENLEEITRKLNAPKEKKVRPADRVVKLYIKYFKNEEDMMNRVENLLREYIEKKNLEDKTENEE